MIFKYPSGSPPSSRPSLLGCCSGRAVLALVRSATLYTLALSAALSAGGVFGSGALQRSLGRPVASPAPLLQGSSSSLVALLSYRCLHWLLKPWINHPAAMVRAAKVEFPTLAVLSRRPCQSYAPPGYETI